MPKPTTLGLNGPGVFSKAAIEQAVRELPENELSASATSTDLQSADVVVSVQKTWRNGWGLGWWGSATVGAGKPEGATGVQVKKKL